MLSNVGPTALEKVKLKITPALPAEIEEFMFRSIKPQASAVAVCLRQPEANADYEVAITQRSAALRHYPGFLVLPGGRADTTDRNITHTALRELEEELGIRPSSVIGRLTPLVTIDFNFVTTPVVCLAQPDAKFTLKGEGEVANARWSRPKDFVARGHPYFERFRNPTQIFLIETLARLWPVDSQESSPEEWFGLHNTLSYMAYQWQTLLRFAEFYARWGTLINKTKKNARARKVFGLLATEQLGRAEILKNFFPDANPERYLSERETDESAALFSALELDLTSPAASRSWSPEQWDKLCQGLFVMYWRGVEQSLGLRRVLHQDIRFAQSEPFWRANQFWSVLLRDSFLSTLSIYRLCPELRDKAARDALFRTEPACRQAGPG